MSSTENITQQTLPLHKIEKFGLAILAMLLIYLVIIALRCNVQFYDSFEYLNNAREWIGIHTRYDLNRPPCFPIILLPIAFLSKFLNSPGLFERFPYFLMIFSGMSAVLLFWWMIRSSLSPQYSMLAVLGLAFNGLYLHYWIFLMPEVFACLLLFIYWRFVLKENYLLAGIILGTILSLRYQLAPLGVLSIIYAIVTEKGNWLKLLKNWTQVALVSALVLLAFHYVFVTIGGNINLLEAYKQVSEHLFNQFWGAKPEQKPDTILALLGREFQYLFHFVTAPILILSLVGMLKALYRREKLDILFLIWFWGIFLTYALVVQVKWKEARYLLVVFPPLYYFFSLGFALIWQYFSKVLLSHHPILRIILLPLFLLALLTAPISHTKKELLRMSDIIYTRDVGHNLAKIIKPNLAPNQATFWIGSYYTIAPKDYYFSIPEKFFFFNLFSNGLSFYLEQPCFFNYTEEFIYQGAVGSYAVVNRNLCQDCGYINNFNAVIPLTVHKVEAQTKYYNTHKTITRSSNDISTTFTVFASEKGEELYLTEIANQLIIDKGNLEPSPNSVIQFIFTGERLPIYPEPSFFGLPSQVPLTPKRKLANIEFVFVSELSTPIGKVL